MNRRPRGHPVASCTNAMLPTDMRYLGIVAAAFLATGTLSGVAQAAPDILLIIGDDTGVETLASERPFRLCTQLRNLVS